jgi:predicted CXXCH cytochrome family protein
MYVYIGISFVFIMKTNLYIPSKIKSMKKAKLLLISAILLVLSQWGYAQHIAGSGHDFSTQTWNTSGEICIVCHAPHNANTTVANAPLWNHTLSATANYTLYAVGGTMNATVGQPDGSSKLCLSCHDGTVALENFGGVASGTHLITGGALLSTSLANDHPISITYDAALATTDGGLFNPVTTQSGINGGTITNTMLIAGKMQCSSCHDVHNSSGVANLLIKSNQGSALCLTCHNK